MGQGRGSFYLRTGGASRGAVNGAVNGGHVPMGPYTVSGTQAAAVTPAGVDDHGNALAQATDLVVTLVATVSGSSRMTYDRSGLIEASGDVDVYKFSLGMDRLSINAVVSGIAGTRGLVRSSIDADVQRLVRAVLDRQLAALGQRNVRDAAAVVVDNETGRILAWLGSAGAASRAAAHR